MMAGFFEESQIMELCDHKDRSPSCKELGGFNAAHGKWGIERSWTMKRGPTSRSITKWRLGRHVDETEDFEPENMQERSTKQVKWTSRNRCKEVVKNQSDR